MKLKANLHLHCGDDKEDIIPYSFIDILDEAKRCGFTCIALTAHNSFINKEEYKKAAEERGILFVPGIERSIERRHVVILNPDNDVLNVKTFADLARYRAVHPEIFVIAPHPFLGTKYSMSEKLSEHIGLFDAIEKTWFYSYLMNPNTKAEAIAKIHSLPFISTSDTHELRLLKISYAEIEVVEKTIPALFTAIREKKFTNVARPRSFFFEMVPYVLYHTALFYLTGQKKRLTKLPRVY